jgi:transcriptional regulator with XRE-family HTH domain
MNSQKMGAFISELRKSKNMTQKELAEKLNVTDKAVSKWERGIGYPEITITPLLAEQLGVSVNELLLGEHLTPENSNSEAVQQNSTDNIISDVVEYVKQTKTQKSGRAAGIALWVMSCIFLLAIFTCMLCNFAISKTFSWSLYVVGSTAMAWLVTTPLLLLKKHRLLVSMAAFTVSILLLLMLIEYLCPAKNWVIPFALPITISAVASLWVAVLLFAYTKINRLYVTSLILILYGVIMNISINTFVSHYLKTSPDNISNVIIAISSGFAAIVLAVIAFLHKNKQK